MCVTCNSSRFLVRQKQIWFYVTKFVDKEADTFARNVSANIQIKYVDTY